MTLKVKPMQVIDQRVGGAVVLWGQNGNISYGVSGLCYGFNIPSGVVSSAGWWLSPIGLMASWRDCSS